MLEPDNELIVLSHISHSSSISSTVSPFNFSNTKLWKYLYVSVNLVVTVENLISFSNLSFSLAPNSEPLSKDNIANLYLSCFSAVKVLGASNVDILLSYSFPNATNSSKEPDLDNSFIRKLFRYFSLSLLNVVLI